jgi:hypothetical protein
MNLSVSNRKQPIPCKFIIQSIIRSNTGHARGSIYATMKVIKIEKRGKHLNILENTTYIELVKTDYP